ncbi:histidine kinase OS=Streptomyces albaduncus OX=68172 GN=FHS32_001030 PE=4 SV=1 [Streptomyces griseoloalbus]
MANLVGNALRHGAEPVTVRLSKRGGALIVEVHDNGPWIAPDALPHFDRFYKADAARARSSGSGLGLAITEEKSNGCTAARSSLRNAPGGGALFTVELPFEGPASASGAPDGPLPAQASEPPDSRDGNGATA